MSNFRKRVEPLTLDITDQGEIRITQEDPKKETHSIILVSPDQIDQFIDWLKQANESINSNQASGRSSSVAPEQI